MNSIKIPVSATVSDLFELTVAGASKDKDLLSVIEKLAFSPKDVSKKLETLPFDVTNSEEESKINLTLKKRGFVDSLDKLSKILTEDQKIQLASMCFSMLRGNFSSKITSKPFSIDATHISKIISPFIVDSPSEQLVSLKHVISKSLIGETKKESLSKLGLSLNTENGEFFVGIEDFSIDKFGSLIPFLTQKDILLIDGEIVKILVKSSKK